MGEKKEEKKLRKLAFFFAFQDINLFMISDELFLKSNFTPLNKIYYSSKT